MCQSTTTFYQSATLQDGDTCDQPHAAALAEWRGLLAALQKDGVVGTDTGSHSSNRTQKCIQPL